MKYCECDLSTYCTGTNYYFGFALRKLRKTTCTSCVVVRRSRNRVRMGPGRMDKSGGGISEGSCRHCINITKWMPVIFIVTVIAWSYYAFVVEVSCSVTNLVSYFRIRNSVIMIIFIHRCA